MAFHGTLLFHLNLCYSAIEREEHGEVVKRCYRPLLALLEQHPWLRLALEASGHTLELIQAQDPAWVEELGAYWRAGRVEFVGCGDTQLIGPIVPASVNHWNQQLGQKTYAQLLGKKPEVALVNEMAWSQGLVDAYLEADYRTLVMEWNNPHKNHREWPTDWRYRMARTESPTGKKIQIAWVDAIAFQKFQRVVHDDIDLENYLAWVSGQVSEESRHLFLYASDAEVFDYRPGRYESEAELGESSEWVRMGEVLEGLRETGISFSLPSELQHISALAPNRTLCLRSAADPVPVKKQPKYNVTRWGLTGRDDVRLNSQCFARAKNLDRRGGTEEEWQELCRAWASDLRTHLTERRWKVLASNGGGLRTANTLVDETLKPVSCQATAGNSRHLTKVERDGRWMNLRVGGAQARISLRRGLAIEALSFDSIGDDNLIGTVSHGALDDIDWAADFYSGHMVVDVPAGRRVTDLAKVEPTLEQGIDWIRISADIGTPLGTLKKSLTLKEDKLSVKFDLSQWPSKPLGSTRLGYITFEPKAFGQEVCITTACGGPPEAFPLVDEFDHSGSVSPLVSARAAFGASDGLLSIDDGRRGIDLSWSPEQSAAMPLVTHRTVDGQRFLRVAFSLGEIDETTRPGGFLPSFELSICPSLKARKKTA